MWTVILLAIGTAMAQDEVERVCPDDAAEQLVVAALAAEETFWALEVDRFDVVRGQLRGLLPCVTRSMTLEESLVLHRAFALDAYVLGDLEAVRRSFGALRMLDPAWLPPAPEGHPLWALFHEAPIEVTTARLVVMPEGGWSVDGTYFEMVAEGEDPLTPDEEVEPHSLPSNRAFVLQVFDLDAMTTYTGYHFSPVDIPITDLVVVPDRAALRKKRRKLSRQVGTAIGSALLVGAGVTFGLGMAERAEVTGGDTELDGLKAVQLRGNTYGWTSAGLATLGATTFGLAWGVRW
jgi:hypothetical protein